VPFFERFCGIAPDAVYGPVAHRRGFGVGLKSVADGSSGPRHMRWRIALSEQHERLAVQPGQVYDGS